jgi:fibronectin type 3 domain-containing protein
VTGGVTFTTNAANPSAAIALFGTGVQPPPVNHSAVLTWDPSTSSGVVGYYVYRGPAAAGPFAVLNGSPVSATTYTDNTVQSGQAYYYVVTSVNSSNVQSPYSNPVSVTIP